MSYLLAIAIVCQMTDIQSPIATDETVCFFPTYAKQGDDGQSWQFRIRGWIFEPEQDSIKRRALLAGLEKLLGAKDDQAAGEIFRSRVAAFLVDNERNKEIAIRIGNRQHVVGISNENGHFEGTLVLTADELAGLRAEGVLSSLSKSSGIERLKYEAVMPKGDRRKFQGEVLLIPPSGVSVISDIDDTIKITEVTSHEKLLQNTLFRPFEAVPGMAEVYRQWADDGAAFHYVTASPWQLYEPLCCLCGPQSFPAGTWHMKLFRWKDSTALDLFKSSEKYKPEILEQILKDFPQRKFILVGDSGERDPEIYGAIARKHPQQIERILIRSVTSDAPEGNRYQTAFAELSPNRWQVFEKPDQIKPPPR